MQIALVLYPSLVKMGRLLSCAGHNPHFFVSIVSTFGGEQQVAKMPEDNTEKKQKAAEEPVKLKDPMWAAFLAWLVPGLGHLYQGRTAKAILFFVCIMSTFAYGVYLGSDSEYGIGRVVYASWRPGDKRFPYLCQIGVGIPAFPALIQAMGADEGKKPFGEFMAPPRLQTGEDDLQGRPSLHQLHRSMARYFELGTVYTMIAGLLNILAIFDAFAGPVVAQEMQNEDEAETAESPDNAQG